MRYYFIIFIVAILFRFSYLNLVPNAISGDELHYITTAKFITLTGHDISGTWNPWSLLWFRYPPTEHQAELPYLLHLLSGARSPFSLFLIKLPFAILSVGIVILLTGIATELFGSLAGITTGTVAAINPWLIVMGRTGYEATPAMFFYLLALYLLLKTTKRNILWAGVPLILAFYSYIGTKIIILPFTILACALTYIKNDKKYLRLYITLIICALLVTLGFFYLTKTDQASRLGDLFLPGSRIVAQDVNAIRQTSIWSPLMTLVVNKYVLYAETILHKFFRAISPSYLFVDGDQFFLPTRQGFFYYIDALFLIPGIVFISKKKRAYAWILLSLLIIATIPQLASTTIGDFSIHLTMLFPLLLIPIGAGIAWMIGYTPKYLRPGIIFVIICVYGVSAAGFSQTYFYRAPLVGYADFPKRILTNYLRLSQSRNIPVVVYSSSTQETFQKYMLYADVITKEYIPALQTISSSESIKLNGITFLPCQSPAAVPAGTTSITDALCGKPASSHHQSITTLTDGGENYIIEEDRVCNTYALKRYPQNIRLRAFAIEQLSESEFCETFISQR